MKTYFKNIGRNLLRYYFFLWYDYPSKHWTDFWIGQNFQEYLKFRKYARYHHLFDEQKTYIEQDKLIMYAILHDYFWDKGYKGVVATDNFSVKYLIWRYTL